MKSIRALRFITIPFVAFMAIGQSQVQQIGREVAIDRHLQDGEEFDSSIPDLIRYGKKLFEAHFTAEDGAMNSQSRGSSHTSHTCAALHRLQTSRETHLEQLATNRIIFPMGRFTTIRKAILNHFEEAKSKVK